MKKENLISRTYRIKKEHHEAIRRRANKQRISQSGVIREFAEALTR